MERSLDDRVCELVVYMPEHDATVRTAAAWRPYDNMRSKMSNKESARRALSFLRVKKVLRVRCRESNLIVFPATCVLEKLFFARVARALRAVLPR